jgi:hypothetical protein
MAVSVGLMGLKYTTVSVRFNGTEVNGSECAVLWN